MATLSKKNKGAWAIQFRDDHGRRKTISLGNHFTERTARELRDAVERLVRTRDNGTPLDRRTETWIQTACVEILDKLTQAGLVRIPARVTLGEIWKSFMDQKANVKDATLETYEHSKRRFFLFFDAGEEISDLTTARLEEWKEFLRTKVPRDRSKVLGLAKSTIAGTVTKAKAVFNWAVRSELLDKSPLDGIGRGSFINREKDRHITMDEYRRLLDACPCQDWRTIIALARIGGIRCPSELLRLRWMDVNFERSRFYVRSPKTEHHAGKEGRLVPLFPELRIELERHFEDERSEGAEFVINRYRDPERTNLGTQFGRIVQLAGIGPIEKPFTNMRASRSTEVYAEFGAFLESKWIGHSSKTARDHYLQVREIDFELATRTKPANGNQKSDVAVHSERIAVSPKNVAVDVAVANSGNERK